MKKEKTFSFIFIIVAFIGFALFVYGLISVINFENYKKTAIQSKAIVKEVASTENQVRKFPIIEYDLNGANHAAVLNSYDTSLKVGQELNIYYTSEKPDEVVISKANIFYYLSPVIGAVVFLGSIVALYLRKKNT